MRRRPVGRRSRRSTTLSTSDSMSPSDTPAAPRVFISYSHDTPEHSRRVVTFAQALRDNGIDVELDQFHQDEILDWPRWCNEKTSREESDFVVCLCTVECRRRIEGK